MSQTSPSHYPPFGSSLPNRTWSDVSRVYRYGFNGQEKDFEINDIEDYFEFKFRLFDAKTGRFISIDPINKKYPWNGNYNFCENKVIRFVENEGLESAESILWNDIGINQNTANQCVETVNKCASEVKDITDKYIIPTVTIAGGAIAIAATAGAATPSVFATVTTVLSGSMAISGGLIKIGLNLAGETEAEKVVPTSYVGATFSATLKIVNGDNSTTKTITGVLELIEGGLSMNFPTSNELEKAGNIISIVSMTYTAAEIMNNINNSSNSDLNQKNFKNPVVISSTQSSGSIQSNRISKLPQKATLSKINDKKFDPKFIDLNSSGLKVLKTDQDVLQSKKAPIKLVKIQK
jgi:RHS repeat-associated protein